MGLASINAQVVAPGLLRGGEHADAVRLFGTLSGSIFFKMIMLLALCPVMERLFLAFPLDRVAFRRKPLPNADSALFPSAIRERIYLSTPLILAQISAILLLLLLTFSCRLA